MMKASFFALGLRQIRKRNLAEHDLFGLASTFPNRPDRSIGIEALAGLQSRFQQCALGVTAVEFAFVLPIFFGLVFGVIETGWLMTKFSMIDRAVTNASRFVYTGAVSTGSSITRETLENFICEDAALISDCTNNIALELVVIDPSFEPPATNAPCRESDVGISPTTSFQPGASSDVVFMRVCVTTEIFMPLIGLGFALPKTDNGNYQFTASSAFANEPF